MRLVGQVGVVLSEHLVGAGNKLLGRVLGRSRVLLAEEGLDGAHGAVLSEGGVSLYTMFFLREGGAPVDRGNAYKRPS